MSDVSTGKSAVRQRLTKQWLKWSTNPLDRPNTAAALDRLESEVTTLAGAGYGWVNRDMSQFSDARNYQSYCLEVHFAAGFLAGGIQLQHAVPLLLPENKSDFDFV